MKNKNQILKFLGSKSFSNKNCQIQSLYLDSRQCNNTSAFIALKGHTTDGNKYIKDALDKGVKLVLSDTYELISKECFFIYNIKDRLANLAKWFYNYKKPYNIIGVTSTNGKTSISNYIAQFLYLNSEKSLILSTIGNGVYPNLQSSTHTTLDILSLYEVIFKFNNTHVNTDYFNLKNNIFNFNNSFYKCNNLIVEVSSHALDQKRVDSLEFDIVIFGNLSHDHLDYHKNMNNYFKAKSRLFQFKTLKKAIINIDNKYGKKLNKICNCDIITVSLKTKDADFYIDIKNICNMKIIFNLYIYQKYIGTYQTLLIGEFNLMNLGLSLASLYDYFNKKKLLSNISEIKSVCGRMEIINFKNNIKFIIDYAHNPDALQKALKSLKKYSKFNLWCIFGCGGNRDRSKRFKMAKIVEMYADKIVVTEDNSRFEKIENIFSDIKIGFNYPEKHIFISSRKEAIKYVIKNISYGDIVLLAGKGHEKYLEKNGIKKYFDERKIINKYKNIDNNDSINKTISY